MSRLKALVADHTTLVVHSSVALAIEQIATEAAEEMLRDPAFRAELKAIARQSFEHARRDLVRSRPARRGAK